MNGIFSGNTRAEEIRVGVASNFLSTLEVIKSEYETVTGNVLVVSNGSTGSLYAQIINGAPYDVFLSADQERPFLISDSQSPSYRVIPYAYGQLALWHPKIISDSFNSWQTLLNDGNYRAIAIANPDLAPYGKASLEAINSLDNAESIKRKLVLGHNIGQAYTIVATGNSEIGFVALSQLINQRTPLSKQHYQILPQSSYTPIVQSAIQISDKSAASDFLTFLQSETARRIIVNAGYGVPEL